jgi:hypothetical protein
VVVFLGFGCILAHHRSANEASSDELITFSPLLFSFFYHLNHHKTKTKTTTQPQTKTKMTVCIQSQQYQSYNDDNNNNMMSSSTSSCSSLSYRWPERFAKMISDKVHQQVHDMLKGSRLTRKVDNTISLVRPCDIYSVDNVVGSGAFSEVSAVTAKDGRRYACKHLKQSLMDRPEEFQLAAAELAIEAHILSSFDHPNILRIRGWAENGIASFEEGQHNSFFLMLDLLDETLNQRIERWRSEQEQHDLVQATSFTPHQPNQRIVDHMRYQTLYLQKIQIMTQIAAALDYIHSNGVIFRGKSYSRVSRLL